MNKDTYTYDYDEDEEEVIPLDLADMVLHGLHGKEASEAIPMIPMISASELVQNFSKYLQQINRPVPSGFPALDQLLGGGIRGLCVCGGLSGVGKSAFALQIAEQIALAQQYMTVLYYSIEMSPPQMIARLMARAAYLRGQPEYTEQRIMSGNRPLRLYEDTMSYDNLCFSALPDRPYSIQHIVDDAKLRAKLRHDKNIFIIVDYLQIAGIEDTMANRYDRRTAIDQDISILAGFCHKYGVSALVLSSLNRTNYRERISLSALKESGNVEYSADQIIGLQVAGTGTKNFNYTEAMQADPRRIEAIVLKNRFGAPETSVCYDYYAANSHFNEISVPKPLKSVEEIVSEQTAAACKYAQQKGYRWPVGLTALPFPPGDIRNEIVLRQCNRLIMDEIQREQGQELIESYDSGEV